MTEFAAVVDSGKREEFNTGSKRDSRAGKGRFDLLSPIVLFRDARHMENGAVKYGDRNWEKGQPISRYWDSAVRHLVKWLMGLTDEDHLAAARWNIGGIMHTVEMVKLGKLPMGLIDLPDVIPTVKLITQENGDGHGKVPDSQLSFEFSQESPLER